MADDSKTIRPPERASRAPGAPFWTRVFERADALVYILVGLCFLVAAFISLAYAIARFAGFLMTNGAATFGPNSTAATAVIDFVSDLLLTIIIMEVLGTIIHYLATRATSLKPFLFIGIVSATRGILAVGARLSIQSGSHITDAEFRQSMIELGVNAAVIIALGITMRLIGRYLEDDTKNVPDDQADRASS